MTADTAPNQQRRPLVNDANFRLMLPQPLLDAINTTAAARGMSTAGWLRDAATTICQLQGVLPIPSETDQ